MGSTQVSMYCGVREFDQYRPVWVCSGTIFVDYRDYSTTLHILNMYASLYKGSDRFHLFTDIDVYESYRQKSVKRVLSVYLTGGTKHFFRDHTLRFRNHRIRNVQSKQTQFHLFCH